MENQKHWKLDVLSRLIANAKKYREPFDKIAGELERYANGASPEDSDAWHSDNNFDAKVYKTSQYIREVGARMYNRNPTVNVHVSDHHDINLDPEAWYRAKMRGEVMQDYLQYCIQETLYAQNMREALTESYYSYGIIIPGIADHNRSACAIEQDSWRNHWFDPDNKKRRHGNYWIRRRYAPKWKLRQDYPHVKQMITDDAIGTCKPSDRYVDASDLPGDTTSELVEYYEVYMRVGLHHYRDGMADGSGVDAPRKYCVIPDQFILSEGEWETPLHMDGRWPFACLSYYEDSNGPYPISPLRQGLGWQRALNWCATMLLAKYGVSSKQIVAFLDQLGLEIPDEAKEEILYSPDPITTISLQMAGHLGVDNDVDVRKYIQSVSIPDNVDGAMQMMDFLGARFEEETGMSPAFISGEPQTQDRSAAATEFRQSNLYSRIDDMQAKFDEFQNQSLRSLSLTAMFHQTADDISKVLSPSAGALWGQLLAASDRDDPNALINQYEEAGLDTEQARLLAEQTLATGTTLEEWAAETSVEIEAGSTRRKSPQEMEAVYDRLNNQVGPMLAQQGMPLATALLAAKQIELAGGDQDIAQEVVRIGRETQQMVDTQRQMQMQQMMQPQPAPAQGGSSNAAV